MLDDLQARLRVDGRLRHGRLHEAGRPRLYFVSAELLPAGEERDFSGKILTWAARSLEPGAFGAVDENARRLSSAPPAPFDVRRTGAITSRGCVLPSRGSEPNPDCQPGFEDLC